MRTIKFSNCPIEKHKGEPWVKIVDRKINQTFTTFRAYDWKKDLYYRGLLRQVLMIENNNQMVGKALLAHTHPVFRPQVTIDEIQRDTFPDFTQKDFDDILYRFYKDNGIVLLKLYLDWVDVRK